MNDFNQRYDFDRSQSPQNVKRRLQRIALAILIMLVVLAVTGTIIYFIIPHETTKTGPEPTGGEKAPTTVETQPANTVSNAGGTAAGNTASGAGAAGGSEEGKTATGAEVNSTAQSENSGTEAPATQAGGVTDPLERAMIVVVRPGDTLEKIANRHFSTVAGIKYFNKLKGDKIIIGQKLKVIPGPWRITVIRKRNELILEHHPDRDGVWTLFCTFPADADGMKGIGISEFAVSFMRRHPEWTDSHGGRFKYGDPANPYGEYLLMLARRQRPNDPLIGLGIHGVDDKAANIRNCGRGCIHVGARDVELLYHLVCPGTEVTVTSGETSRNLEN